MKLKKSVVCIGLSLISILYIILVKFVDVAQIGPKNSSVGFSHVNKIFNNIFSYNPTIYKITEILGYLALLVVGIYGLIGLYQLIKRKSLKKVDKELIILGIFYVVVICIYVLFEKVIINYRPVILDGVLEASFPSSHTLLAICVCGSGIIVNNKIFKDYKYINIINKCLLVLLILIVIGRLISGVHWLSDIIGGVIIASTILYIFNYVLNKK